ncbi:hypothetical protein [Streptomyces sp. NPDC004658]
MPTRTRHGLHEVAVLAGVTARSWENYRPEAALAAHVILVRLQ